MPQVTNILTLVPTRLPHIRSLTIIHRAHALPIHRPNLQNKIQQTAKPNRNILPPVNNPMDNFSHRCNK